MSQIPFIEPKIPWRLQSSTSSRQIVCVSKLFPTPAIMWHFQSVRDPKPQTTCNRSSRINTARFFPNNKTMKFWWTIRNWVQSIIYSSRYFIWVQPQLFSRSSSLEIRVQQRQDSLSSKENATKKKMITVLNSMRLHDTSIVRDSPW